MNLKDFIISLWPVIPVFIFNKIFFKKTYLALILTFEFLLFWIIWRFKSMQEQQAWDDRFDDDQWWRDYNARRDRMEADRQMADMIRNFGYPEDPTDLEPGVLRQPSYPRDYWVPELHKGA